MDDDIFNSIRGSVWRLSSGAEAKFKATGEFETQSCNRGRHRECRWHVSAGKILVEWGTSGLFLAEPQQDSAALQHDNEVEAISVLNWVALRASIQHHHRGPATIKQRAATDDYYSVLGIADTADKSEVKKAYRRMSVIYHPDKNSGVDAAAMFNSVRTAYEVLSHEEKRRVYDTGTIGWCLIGEWCHSKILLTVILSPGGKDAVERYEKGELSRTSDSRGELDISLDQASYLLLFVWLFVCFGQFWVSVNDKQSNVPVIVLLYILNTFQVYNGAKFDVNVKRRVVCRGYVCNC